MTKRAPVPRLIFAVVRPFREFFRTQAAGGVLLMVATAFALVLANSRYAGGYHAFLDFPVTIALGGRGISWPLHHWINDALMAVFFLVVGMEIKRELLVGELRTLRRATLPLVAALGGMMVPAAIHYAINAGGPAENGWGIPMATDIAFALGCVALVSRRVPSALVVFLMALAIFDDLGAILVIAIFYGGALDVGALLVAGVLTVVLVAMLWSGVTRVWPYAVAGIALWLAVLQSGIHATIAGVILGLCIPARGRRRPSEVLGDLERAIMRLRRNDERDLDAAGPIGAIERHLEAMQPPLDRLVHGLHGWVAFLIVPVFAIANAGVSFTTEIGASARSPAALGVAFGLALGKPIGIAGATWIAVRSGLAPKPTGATWVQIFAISILAGIGFTMSIFVATLAFPQQPELQDLSKLGIFGASFFCAIVGLGILRRAGRDREAPDAAPDLELDLGIPRFAEGFRLEAWAVGGPVVGQSMKEVDLRSRFDVSAVGVARGGRGSVTEGALEPVGPQYVFTAGDTLLLVGRVEDVERAIRELSK